MAFGRILKWCAIVVFVLLIVAFIAFLYLIPPFTLTPPEAFIKAAVEGTPEVSGISDPATRALAQRGRYLVQIHACADCHVTPGPRGPQWDMYLAGGFKGITPDHTQVVSRNLTPDPETGIAGRTDDQIKRTISTGILYSGRAMYHRSMPWAGYSRLSEEDLHAIVVFLRHIKPVRHAIPDPAPGVSMPDPAAVETLYGGADYGVKQ